VNKDLHSYMHLCARPDQTRQRPHRARKFHASALSTPNYKHAQALPAFDLSTHRRPPTRYAIIIN